MYIGYKYITDLKSFYHISLLKEINLGKIYNTLLVLYWQANILHTDQSPCFSRSMIFVCQKKVAFFGPNANYIAIEKLQGKVPLTQKLNLPNTTT